MPDEGDDKVNPAATIGRWLIANGKEATAFGIVLAAAVWMFTDMRDQTAANRVQQAAEYQANRAQQADIFKELRERETRAWDTRSHDRSEAWKHADEANQRIDRLTKAVEDLTRAMTKPKE